MKSFNWLLVLSVLSCIGCSSPVHEDGRGCAFVSDSIQYRVEFMSAGCVRILSFPEGDSYRYEEGVCSKVPMQWKDSERTLTIGLREGTYPGMPEQIKMHVKLYLPEGAALDSKECVYTGREVKIKF